MALSDADLDAAWTKARSKNGPQWVPYFEALRAVEALVRKDYDALILQLVEALECNGEPDDPGHRCSHCDEYVDRNSVLRKAARARLEGKP